MYVLPSKRNIISEQPPSSKIVCKWCHEPGHLSISCKFKGQVQQKKPEMFNTQEFPRLNPNISTPQKETTWGKILNIELLKKIPHSMEEKRLTRVSSSNLSLDTLTSTGSEMDSELEEMIHTISMKDVHPYDAYYMLKIPLKITRFMEDLEFKTFWYCREHYPLMEDALTQETV